MQKILIVVLNDKPGGAEQFLKMIATYYLKQGAIVNVFFLTKKNNGYWESLKNHKNFNSIYTNSSKELNGIPLFIKKIIAKRNIDYHFVFTSHILATCIVGLLRKTGLIKTKYFVGRESTSIFKRYSGLKLALYKLEYRLGYNALDLLICQSYLMKKQLLENLPTLFEKIDVRVIGNPIDLDSIQTSVAEAEYSSLQNMEYVVSAGRFIPEKGFDILIEAFSEVKKDFPSLKLIILGEGLLRHSLEAQIEKSNLKSEVLLLGFIDNVYSFFSKARVCVVSSRIEGFPNVLLQMMSQNNNVVSTLCAGDIDKIKGIYKSETNNTKALVVQITSCLKNDNSANRILFDAELESRNLNHFITKIESYLNEG